MQFNNKKKIFITENNIKPQTHSKFSPRMQDDITKTVQSVSVRDLSLPQVVTRLHLLDTDDHCSSFCAVLVMMFLQDTHTILVSR